MCDDNRDPFITTLHNVLLALDICNRLFSIITLMNSVHTCLFHKGLCKLQFGYKEKNTFALPHISQQKYAFGGRIKQMSKSKKLAPRKKVSLELLYHRLGHRYTRSLVAVDTANVWKGIGLMIDSDPFCTSSQIYSMNRKAGSKNPLNPKAPFKWVLWVLLKQRHQNV